jgi:Flp pilus assembly protein TadD
MFANKTHEAAHLALKNNLINEAILLYSKAIEESPNHPDIYADRGVAYLHNKDKSACLHDLNKAIELQPNYSYRYASRAYAKNNFGDLQGAIADYEIALRLDPDDAIAHNNLGLLLEQKGYAEEAQMRFTQADNLAKIQNNLINDVDDPSAEEKSKQRRFIPPGAYPIKKSFLGELKLVFTSKKHFTEFIRFIKNGFKIK